MRPKQFLDRVSVRSHRLATRSGPGRTPCAPRRALRTALTAVLVVSLSATIVAQLPDASPGTMSVRPLGPVRLTDSGSGGTTWVDERAPNVGPLSSISCPSASVCVAVGGTTYSSTGILVTTDGGSTWHSVTGPGSGGEQVSCASVTLCAVSGVSSFAQGDAYDLVDSDLYTLDPETGAFAVSLVGDPTTAPVSARQRPCRVRL